MLIGAGGGFLVALALHAQKSSAARTRQWTMGGYIARRNIAVLYCRYYVHKSITLLEFLEGRLFLWIRSVCPGRRRLRLRRRARLAIRSGRGRRRLRFACWRNRNIFARCLANLRASARGLFGDRFRDSLRAIRLALRWRIARAGHPAWRGPWRKRRSDNFAHRPIPSRGPGANVACPFRRTFPSATRRRHRCAPRRKRKNSRAGGADARRFADCRCSPCLRGYSLLIGN